jgi:hypothetical protein
VAIEKYLRDKDYTGRNKDQLLELIGDVVFGVPSVIVSRGHRGESLRLNRRETYFYPLSSVTGLLTNICKWETANIKSLRLHFGLLLVLSCLICAKIICETH